MNILKILTTIVVLFSISITPVHRSFAQEEDSPAIELETEEVNEEEVTEEKESLKDVLEQEEEIQSQPKYSLGTLLLAILIPCIFVILIYLIFKFFKF